MRDFDIDGDTSFQGSWRLEVDDELKKEKE
jgi:hypothetical protein